MNERTEGSPAHKDQEQGESDPRRKKPEEKQLEGRVALAFDGALQNKRLALTMGPATPNPIQSRSRHDSRHLAFVCSARTLQHLALLHSGDPVWRAFVPAEQSEALPSAPCPFVPSVLASPVPGMIPKRNANKTGV